MRKTVLITGAATGIGRASSLLFAAKGYKVFACYNTSGAEAESLRDEIMTGGGECELLKADLSDKAELAALVTRIEKAFPFIDVLVNNAGVAKTALSHETAERDYDRLFAVNMKAAFVITNAVLVKMLREKRGKIVNVSSVWGVAGGSCETAYSASKAALIGYTRALAKEAGPSGITVNCVCPGVIDTAMNSNLSYKDKQQIALNTPLCRLGTPSDVANAIFFLAGEDSGFITGQTLTVDGGFLGI